MQRSGNALSPSAAAIFASSAALTVHREAALGVTLGHDDVLAVIDSFLTLLDPDD